MLGRLYGLSPQAARRRADELLERFDPVEAADRLAGTYSGGVRRRLDVAASLVAAPPVLAWIGGLLLATVPAAILRYRHATA